MMFGCSNHKDMKQLINLLNTTLQAQPKPASSGRPDSASDSRAPLSSVAAPVDSDNSDVAIVQPHAVPRQKLGVTFVKASPTVITVPTSHWEEPNNDHDDDDDSVCCGVEPRFQLGAFFIKLLFMYFFCLGADFTFFSTVV